MVKKLVYFNLHRIIRCLLILAFIYFWAITQANAQLFSIDQLVNSSHAETWNTFLGPKGYISYYYNNIWRPQHQEDDLHEFSKFRVPMPESLFTPGFFINKGDFVAVFQNSILQSIDRISGFWGRSTIANSHMYIGLENNGLKDAWDVSYTGLYIIDTTLSDFEKFRGVNLKTGTPYEYDSILSCALTYLIEHRKLIHDIWRNADTLISFDSLKQSIQDSFNITIFVADFTDDDIDDFILKTEQKASNVWRGNAFTFIFESGEISPPFIRWSEFEQIIRANDIYLLMLRAWKPYSGIWGWSIYEGRGDGILKHIFSEFDYST